LIASVLVALVIAIGLSQFVLANSAVPIAVAEYESQAGAGLAAGCKRPQANVKWSGFNHFKVEVWQDCNSPKAGEGMTVHLVWGFGGWSVTGVTEHYVV
jgi:hypothetical protein